MTSDTNKNPVISSSQIQHVAELSDLHIPESDLQDFAEAFDETLSVISNLKQVDVSGVEPTHQVTGLENVTREDVVIEDQMFSQREALANGAETHDGYFVVTRVIDKE